MSATAGNSHYSPVIGGIKTNPDYRPGLALTSPCICGLVGFTHGLDVSREPSAYSAVGPRRARLLAEVPSAHSSFHHLEECWCTLCDSCSGFLFLLFHIVFFYPAFLFISFQVLFLIFQILCFVFSKFLVLSRFSLSSSPY